MSAANWPKLLIKQLNLSKRSNQSKKEVFFCYIVISFIDKISTKSTISQDEENTLTKILIYKQKLEKKILEFQTLDNSNENVKTLVKIQSQIKNEVEKVLNSKIEGISETRVRADLNVLQDYVKALNEKSSSADNEKLLSMISTAFDSGEEKDLFEVHSYVEEAIKRNRSQEMAKILENANEEYLLALHSLKNESNGKQVNEIPSTQDLKEKIEQLNAIISKVGNQKIQGVDIVTLKNQLNDAMNAMKNQNVTMNDENDEVENDNDHYGTIMKKMLGNNEKSFDNENMVDLNEGPRKIKYQIPKSFVRAITQKSISGMGDYENGLNDYLLFLEKVYNLNDVQKILAKKHKDRIMENLPNLCGKEILMWTKQEIEMMLLDFQKAGMHPLKRIEATKDFNLGLVETV